MCAIRGFSHYTWQPWSVGIVPFFFLQPRIQFARFIRVILTFLHTCLSFTLYISWGAEEAETKLTASSSNTLDIFNGTSGRIEEKPDIFRQDVWEITSSVCGDRTRCRLMCFLNHKRLFFVPKPNRWINTALLLQHVCCLQRRTLPK